MERRNWTVAKRTRTGYGTTLATGLIGVIHRPPAAPVSSFMGHVVAPSRAHQGKARA